MKARLLNGESGFSLIETMLVVGIFAVVSAMAAFQVGAVQPSLKGDGGMRTVMAQMNTARELAITQRRVMRVSFANGIVTIQREEVAGPNPLTLIAQVPMEGGVKFNLITGVPDTPEAFGIGSPVAFGTATQYRWSTEGTLLNQTGGLLNGTVYTSIPNQARSMRAVTVLGSTGRIRGYRWDGRAWKQV